MRNNDILNIKIGGEDASAAMIATTLVWPTENIKQVVIPTDTSIYNFNGKELTYYYVDAKNVKVIEFVNFGIGSLYDIDEIPTPRLRIGTNTEIVNLISDNVEYISMCYTLENNEVYDPNITFFRLKGNSKIKAFCFDGCKNLKTIKIFDTSLVTTMRYAFRGCNELEGVPLFNTTNVTSMDNMFWDCNKLKNVPLFDTSNVLYMNNMFSYCSVLENVPLFDTSKVKSMSSMFMSCRAIKSFPLFDTRNVTDMDSTFRFCSNITSIPQFDTSKVKDTEYMFDGCSLLSDVPLLDFSSVDLTRFMFDRCPSLTNLGGFKNLGKGYSKSYYEPAFYERGTLNLSASSLITRESMVNVFNNLYNMNTYSGNGIIKVKVHSTVLSNLLPEDIAIATSKGWSVSA